jgi:hypothetical protein
MRPNPSAPDREDKQAKKPDQRRYRAMPLRCRYVDRRFRHHGGSLHFEDAHDGSGVTVIHRDSHN